MYVRHKYSHDIFCSVTNDNLTYHALFGMLLVVTAMVAASSLLLPGTIMVFAQEADGGDAAAPNPLLSMGPIIRTLIA